MSQRYRQADPYERQEACEPLVWERVEWRQGDGRYTFEVGRGGLHATLTAPESRALTLPMVAWEGLLDALSGGRKTKARGERGFPARSGARWYEGEAGELAGAFRSGRTIAELARAHNRSVFAVEAQLERLGLRDRTTGQALGSGTAGESGGGTDGRFAVPIPAATDRD